MCRPNDDGGAEVDVEVDVEGEGSGRKPLLSRALLTQIAQGVCISLLFFYVTITLNSFDGLQCSDRDQCNPNR